MFRAPTNSQWAPWVTVPPLPGPSNPTDGSEGLKPACISPTIRWGWSSSLWGSSWTTSPHPNPRSGAVSGEQKGRGRKQQAAACWTWFGWNWRRGQGGTNPLSPNASPCSYPSWGIWGSRAGSARQGGSLPPCPSLHSDQAQLAVACRSFPFLHSLPFWHPHRWDWADACLYEHQPSPTKQD